MVVVFSALLATVAVSLPFDNSDSRIEPLSLAAGDLDEDGVADLIAGYSGAEGGILVVRRGNVDAIYGPAESKPFHQASGIFRTSSSPHFLATGDFDADGHVDVVVGKPGQAALYWLAGTGRGNFGNPRRVRLSGALTAFASGEVNRADGLKDVAVAVAGRGRAEILVFEGPNGAFQHEPERIRLPRAATALAIGRTRGPGFSDIVAASGRELLIVRGRDRNRANHGPSAEQISLGFWVRAVEVARDAIAVQTRDGTVHAVKAGSSETAPARLGRFSRNAHLVSDRGDIVVADGARGKLHTYDARWNALDVEGRFTAALPMRLNADARSDWVLLRKGKIEPVIIPTTPERTFVVNSTHDGDPTDDVCRFLEW